MLFGCVTCYSWLYILSNFSNIFTWQTYNALFIIRNLCKYFVENLSEEVVVQQFETKTLDQKGTWFFYIYKHFITSSCLLFPIPNSRIGNIGMGPFIYLSIVAHSSMMAVWIFFIFGTMIGLTNMACWCT